MIDPYFTLPEFYYTWGITVELNKNITYVGTFVSVLLAVIFIATAISMFQKGSAESENMGVVGLFLVVIGLMFYAGGILTLIGLFVGTITCLIVFLNSKI